MYPKTAGRNRVGPKAEFAPNNNKDRRTNKQLAVIPRACSVCVKVSLRRIESSPAAIMIVHVSRALAANGFL